MDKTQVASILDDIAAMLELKGENPFKVRAYQNAARTLLNLPEDLETLVREGRLREVRGIGEALSEKITTLVTTGSLPYYEDLRKGLHPGLLELTRLQGVGPKKAVILYEKLGIKSVPELKKAAEQGKIAKLKGFGPATQENILKAIGFQAEHASEHLLPTAQEAADLVLAQLRQHPFVKRISVCGSLRRHRETVHDADILASTAKADPEAAASIMEHFVKLPGISRVLGQGETKSSVLFHSGLQVDLRVVSDEQFPFALHYFTGSKEHNIVMRQRAQARGYKLSEYGLFETKPRQGVGRGSATSEQGGMSPGLRPAGTSAVRCKDEADLFKKLGLPYIPPELREDGGEFEAAEKGALPKLLELEDIRGVFHVHSTWSDGTVELEDMIAEAQAMGLEYVGISDHSQIAAYAGGLTIDRVKEQGQAIERLRQKFKIRIFWGSECDVLKDGRMDYPDEVLQRYDFVIASVHSFFKLPEAEMTARVIQALRNRYVTILGHITGRLLLRRAPYALNVEEVLKVAGQEGVAVEINSLPDRMELDWRWMRKAKELGCRFSIDPDAHSKEDLHGYGRGVGLARKGWLTQEDVITTLSAKEMTAFLKSRR